MKLEESMTEYVDRLIAAAIAKERERCAVIAERNTDGVHIVLCTNIAQAIRRGNEKA